MLSVDDCGVSECCGVNVILLNCVVMSLPGSCIKNGKYVRVLFRKRLARRATSRKIMFDQSF